MSERPDERQLSTQALPLPTSAVRYACIAYKNLELGLVLS